MAADDEWQSDEWWDEEEMEYFVFDKMTDISWEGLIPWILHTFRTSVKKAVEKQGHDKLTVKHEASEFHIFQTFTDSALFSIDYKSGKYEIQARCR